jgi:5'-nucleotidase
MAKPQDVKNRAGNITTINQVGFAGINLGRIDYHFESYRGKKLLSSSPYMISDQLDS